MFEKPYHAVDISKYSFLVTGGSGFIGANIVDYLMKYNAGKVRVLDNLSTGFKKNIEVYLSSPSFEFLEEDICNLDVCRKACMDIDFVIHHSAIGSIVRSIEDPIYSNNVNINGTLNMLLASKEANVKRFIYATSSSVFGNSATLPITEKETKKPISPYAITKVANELYADVFSNIYGMEIIGLRYFNIFGPKQNAKSSYSAVIPLFIDAMINNQPIIIYGDGEQERDFTFVENAVQANMKALFTENKKALNEVFNIAVNQKTSVIQLFKTLKNISGYSLDPVFKDKRLGDIRKSYADISKAKILLDYNPEIHIEEGLKITYDCFIQNL